MIPLVEWYHQYCRSVSTSGRLSQQRVAELFGRLCQHYSGCCAVDPVYFDKRVATARTTPLSFFTQMECRASSTIKRL